MRNTNYVYRSWEQKRAILTKVATRVEKGATTKDAAEDVGVNLDSIYLWQRTLKRQEARGRSL